MMIDKIIIFLIRLQLKRQNYVSWIFSLNKNELVRVNIIKVNE